MDAYTSSSSAPSRRASWIVRFARRVGYGILEMHYATRRANELLFSYGLTESNQAPDTYAEFLLRARAHARHEPTARSRASGHRVK